ncbi:MAG: 2-oxo acid dehydrogenase subunit E2 [Sedimentisphaerales bacterium]|nr:2-oxo acid dehydrogenase subunit E2 [Sedimentisphaerales bacterium]
MASDAPAKNLPAEAHVVYMPKLSKTMEDATIVSCPRRVGDKVKRADIIFEIETDKATVEIESPFDGVVKAILVGEGDMVGVNYPLMILAEREAEIPDNLIKSLKKSSSKIKSEAQKSFIENTSSYNNTGEIASAAAEQTEMKYKLGQVFTPSRMQKLTAQRMLKSKREIPCFYLTARADVTELVEYRTRLNNQSEVKVGYNDFVIRAVALGLDRFELMTGQLDGDNIRLSEKISIGLAIDTPGGLVAPVIADADKKNVQQIAADTSRLIEKAKNNKLLPEDLEGGCITVSNLGSFGVDSFIPIVIPGQCSILGVGQISETLLPEPKEPQVRKVMNLNLSVDHRVANGAYAGQFLDFVRKLLEDPARF